MRNPSANPQKSRKAEFITPPNFIKQKVGSGGLYQDILDQAEALVQEFNDDFMQDGLNHIHMIGQACKDIMKKPQSERRKDDIETLIYPAFQLQSNAALFGYQLVGYISGKLVLFLENLSVLDNKAMQIVFVFHATLNLIVKSGMTGDGGAKGGVLLTALETLCDKY